MTYLRILISGSDDRKVKIIYRGMVIIMLRSQKIGKLRHALVLN